MPKVWVYNDAVDDGCVQYFESEAIQGYGILEAQWVTGRGRTKENPVRFSAPCIRPYIFEALADLFGRVLRNNAGELAEAQMVHRFFEHYPDGILRYILDDLMALVHPLADVVARELTYRSTGAWDHIPVEVPASPAPPVDENKKRAVKVKDRLKKKVENRTAPTPPGVEMAVDSSSSDDDGDTEAGTKVTSSSGKKKKQKKKGKN